MKKTTVWHVIESDNGDARLTWFLKEEHANKYYNNSEQPLENGVQSVETYEGSDIHKKAVENSKEYEGKHEYLKSEDYYEARSVGTKARSSKTCEHCGRNIPKGKPHDMHHFYPEFHAYATHLKCSQPFIKSLN